MYKNGFLKVSLITPEIRSADISHNVQAILKYLQSDQVASISLFPELCISGYEIHDLAFNADFLEEVLQAVQEIITKSNYQGLYVLGAPLRVNSLVYNCAIAVFGKKVLGIVPKSYLPNTHEFYEKRWYSTLPAKAKPFLIPFLGKEVYFGNIILEDPKKEIKIGIEICEDMWSIYTKGDDYALQGVNIMLNLSASPERVGKHTIRRETINSQSRKGVMAYLYCATSWQESTSCVVYGGAKLVSVCGVTQGEVKPFEELNVLNMDLNVDYINYAKRQESNLRSDYNEVRYHYKKIGINFGEEESPKNSSYSFFKPLNQDPFLPKNNEETQLIINILVESLITKLHNLKDYNKIVLGLSGGLDSTLALLLADIAIKKMKLDPQKQIIAVTMPSQVTSNFTLENTKKLASGLKVPLRVIPITEEQEIHQRTIGANLNITKENIQARIRTMVLMNISNEEKGFVLGTGDLSEIALGWMTYNGDQASMYAINSGIPKTLVRYLVQYLANSTYLEIQSLLLTIANQTITPELLSNQKTEDIIGKYPINDFILYHFLHLGEKEKTIAWLLELAFSLSSEEAKNYVSYFMERFYHNQFKRTTLPDGAKVFSFSLSARGDYRLNNDTWRKK
ncbi:MAG: NAD(+) synthase [Acholeplasmatales bacterium]|jgi:NAD+ synthase (glutamine-hydrolysing)|nr:NAD(+) synthase [Acholeplasmatales bacterium]